MSSGTWLVSNPVHLKITQSKSKPHPPEGIGSLAPERLEWNFRYVIFMIILVMDDWGISCKISLRWMPLDLTDEKSTLVQVMAWCRQATSHYLRQCWHRCCYITLLGHNELNNLLPVISPTSLSSAPDPSSSFESLLRSGNRSEISKARSPLGNWIDLVDIKKHLKLILNVFVSWNSYQSWQEISIVDSSVTVQ